MDLGSLGEYPPLGSEEEEEVLILDGSLLGGDGGIGCGGTASG